MDKQLNRPKISASRLKIRVFTFTMAIIGAVGLLFFARPTVSETEKRKLTEFPTFTVESFASGEYFEGITSWYADTFPGREVLIKISSKIKGLFGIKTEQIVRGNEQEQSSGKNEADEATGEKLGGVYVKGNTAYEIYTEISENSNRYASLISDAAASLSGVTVYDMIVPLSDAVNLSEKDLQKTGSSDAASAIGRMFAQMNGVETVEILNTLKAHNSEYLYFRTDHHWTATGAYYAYTEFCKEAGLSASALDSFDLRNNPGFVGTLMAKAGKDLSGSSDADKDTVVCYLPKSDYSMVCYDSQSGTEYKNFGVVNKVDNASAADKYLAFLGGDHALDVIRNNEIHDGSSICVVKESFGNAFVPFLVDHYETVYVVDYRYFNNLYPTKTLSDYVNEKGIDSVLFINNLTATSVSARLNELEKLING